MKDPIRAAIEAATQPLIAAALADAKRKISAAIDAVFAGLASTETPAKPEKKRGPSTGSQMVRAVAMIRRGTMTDSAIARETGLAQVSVSAKRRSLGLPAVGVKFGTRGAFRGVPKPKRTGGPSRERLAGFVGYTAKPPEEQQEIDAAILAGGTDAEISRRFKIYHGSVGTRRKAMAKLRAASTETLITRPAAVEGQGADPIAQVAEAA